MRLPALSPISGTIIRVSPFARDCCSHLVSLQTSNGIVNFVISPDTYIVECARLRPGMRVTAFYDTNAPVPLIFPPQYRAEVIVSTLSDDNIALQFFDRNLLAADGSLQLNLNNRTNIVTRNGQRYECNPGGNTLLVFYRATTRSIPPQTTPRKIIVFC